ncbi:MAG: hypothetical protein RL514_1995 [Verrucomicrobiota bacterium]|jgi:lysophospholipase L1-like esterase
MSGDGRRALVPCRRHGFANLTHWFLLALLWLTLSVQAAENPARPLRILPVGDSITRGSYLARYEDGPFKGEVMGLPNPEGGGWRKLLQDKLRAAGQAYDFVGALRYHSFGKTGQVDAHFDPDHHGLAGFSNQAILSGGKVPTPRDVLASLGVQEVVVPGIVPVLKQHAPDVVLLLAGANGFNARARDELIRTIHASSRAHLFVGTLLPQRAPRAGAPQVAAYNASLPAVVAAQTAAGHRITLVDLHAAVTPDDLLPDGVHPNRAGMAKMADAWFAALQAAGLVSPK